MNTHVTWVALFNDGRHEMEYHVCPRGEASNWLHRSVRDAILGAGSEGLIRFWYMLGTESQEYLPSEVEEVFFS